MNKRLIMAIGVFTLILISTSRVYSEEWNYFGDCASDDVILAKTGEWYSPSNCGREACQKRWEYAGKYREITKGVIEVYWWTPNGAEGTNHQKTYTHKSLYRNKCRI